MGPDPYVTFTSDEWGRLRALTPLTLTEGDLEHLRGINERVSMDEVAEAYLPLSRLLNLSVRARQELRTVTDLFLGRLAAPAPFVIGVAGSVAVGKSTTARLLQALLARWPAHPRVDLVTTDGFLFPNAVLESRGIMNRKGFPESYDTGRLVRFLAEVKAGTAEVHAPVYNHQVYDIVPGATQVVREPDILIIEGLNVLQPAGSGEARGASVVASDFFDFSIYVDADEADIERWYVERFFALRQTVFTDPTSYFHRFADLTDGQADRFARGIWASINLPNLREHIAPTRGRADLVLEKGPDHRVRRVHLRRL